MSDDQITIETEQENAEHYADIGAEAVGVCRQWAKEGLGFNCTFVDDDMKVMVGLAQRAVLAGLASDFSPDMQKRFMKAAGPHRSDHEKSLGRRLGPQSWIQRIADRLGATRF